MILNHNAKLLPAMLSFYYMQFSIFLLLLILEATRMQEAQLYILTWDFVFKIVFFHIINLDAKSYPNLKDVQRKLS